MANTTEQEQPRKKRKYHKQNLNNHGGAREGAGRPATLDPAVKLSSTIAFCCTDEVKRKYHALKERGANPSKALSDCIEQLASLLGIQ